MLGIKEIIERAQDLQSRISDLQTELAKRTATGSSGAGMVVAEVNGAQELVSIKIEKDLISSEDVEMLEDLIVAAVNDALKKMREMIAPEISKLVGGVKIPGLG